MAILTASEFLSCCNRRPDFAPDNSLPFTGVSCRLAYTGDGHCGVAMMDGAVVLQPAPSELILLPVFLRRVPPRRFAGGTAYQYGFFIKPRGAGGVLRVARHVSAKEAQALFDELLVLHPRYSMQNPRAIRWHDGAWISSHRASG